MEQTPVHTINRARNARETLCRLPSEILLRIMGDLMEDDLAALYLLRQACHRFADLFGSRQFIRYHETETSSDSYLQPFCTRFMDVAFSTHRQRTCYLLERDMCSVIVTGQELEDSKNPRGDADKQRRRLQCHMCNEKHTEDCFPIRQKQAPKHSPPICGIWFGHINICPHCPLKGEDIHDEPIYDPQGVFHSPLDYEYALWTCEECWVELVPPGQTLEDRFPTMKRPSVVYQYLAQSDDFEGFWVNIKWTMPLFADIKPIDKQEPSDDLFTIIERRFQEIARGPYRELLTPTAHPHVSFCAKEILEQLRTKYLGKQPGTVPYSLDFKVSTWNRSDIDAYLSLHTVDGSVYLEFDYTLFGWNQDISRSDREF
jgi:hypothetical protein